MYRVHKIIGIAEISMLQPDEQKKTVELMKIYTKLSGISNIKKF